MLSDLRADEGFFYIKDSHKTPPITFLRKVYEHVPEKQKPGHIPQKCIMLPTVKEEPCAGERVDLNRGDLLIYHGNLSHCLYNVLEKGEVKLTR